MNYCLMISKKRMEESITHAARSIEKRDVKPGFTNIDIRGTLITHLAAHLFDIRYLKAYADMRMKQYILDESTLKMVDYCYQTGWGLLATHYHATISELARPHSRSYSTLLRDSF
jgi:hypothetical protein